MFKLLLLRIIIIIIIIICMTVFSNTCVGFRGVLPTGTYLSDEAKSSRPISVLGGHYLGLESDRLGTGTRFI